MDNKSYILSQYAHSPNLLNLIKGFEEMIGVKGDIEQFYTNIFSIRTANTMGLNVWGKILNIPRILKVGGINYELDNGLYRLLLLTKAMANVSDCTIPNLTRLLNFLFKERGVVYVFDAGIMSMKYVFDFYLTDQERAILTIPGIPPKPTGVGLIIEELPRPKLFGFYKTGFQPFNQGVFRN